MNNNALQSLNSIQNLAADPKEDTQDLVKKEYREGLQYLEKQEYGQAAVALHNALIGFEARQDDTGIANASNQLGHACLFRNEYENALKHYRRALVICEKASDRMSMLAVLAKIVAALKGLKKYDDALSTCLDMMDLYKDNRNPQGTVETLELMAELYLANGQKSKAAHAYKTVSSIHKNFRHDSIAAQYLEKAARLTDDQ